MNTYTLSDAAKVTQFSTSDLRNAINRGYLQYVASAPVIGKEKTFSRLGLYEIGILEILGASMPLSQAGHIISQAISMRRVVGAMSLVQSGECPSIDQALQVIQANPDLLICAEWAHRNLSDPVLWVFGFDNNGLHLGEAFGWDGLPDAVRNLAEKSYPILIPFVAWDAPAPKLPEVPEEYIQTALPHINVFNLTASLYRIDRAISENLSQAQTEIKK